MPDSLKSRKFWFAVVAAVLPHIVQLLTGEITWEMATMASLTVVIGYIFGQSYVDASHPSAVSTSKES